MSDKATDELVVIKKLLMLLLIKLHSNSEEIASALGMHPGAVRNIISIRKIKKLDFKSTPNQKE